ncbi:Down syndrome cell adhesion molecule-like protein Dscam2 [Stegodyphus dumicola]|uniref:Down syndrome cell adhesion molecule-like protein Dscam2 n=1 Tax=Stegodyphus dumicola TaxID=202533 RepID=UPI0015AA057E|nr:Down syndrome cell adhesion molecule-like protein Dscam2 [Stegodyphus dumicola]
MHKISHLIAVYFSFRLASIATFAQDAPKIQKFQFPTKLEVNEKTSVTCMLRRGQPPYVFRWFKDGKEIENGGEITIQTSKFLSTLLVNPVTHAAAGNYTCVVSNSEGKDSYSSSLTVTAAPSWVIEPTDAEAVVGQVLRAICFADGSPKPDIRWTKAGTSFLEWSARGHLENGSLIFSPLKEDDDGEYSCIADNGVGESLLKKIKIIVHGN